MNLFAHYLAVSGRMRLYHIIVLDMAHDGYTRDVSPTTMALHFAFYRTLIQIGNWRDCKPCDEDWRRLAVVWVKGAGE